MFNNSSDYPVLDHCQSRPLLVMERKWKSSGTVELAPNCPRCASPNTKFCYYNNYSLSQPRYFCKGCRRYWTKGGSLRNVPVGGGCRKSRRSRSAKQGEGRGGLSYARGGASSPGGGNDSDGSGEQAADIDMAAVFAKFLNHNSGNTIEEDKVIGGGEESSSGASCASLDQGPSSLDTDSQLEDAIFECQDPSALFYEDQLVSGLPQILSVGEAGTTTQDFANHDPGNTFELHNILGDEMGENIVWSSDGIVGNGTEPNFQWQLQDFGSFPTEDHLIRSSGNLVPDNWSSFDLSAYEIFSRP